MGKKENYTCKRFIKLAPPSPVTRRAFSHACGHFRVSRVSLKGRLLVA